MLLPQYCGITILIDVCSNQSNPPEEKKANDDDKQQQQQQMNIIRSGNSSSPSFQPSYLSRHDHNHNMPIRRSNSYNIVQAFSLGTFVDAPVPIQFHARSIDTGSNPHRLIRLNTDENNNNDDDDDDDDETRPIVRVDTDNDDGMHDITQSNPRVARTDTDNDLDIMDQ